ncbi:MAG TPA: hypothetical protein ENN43_08830, partial [bacterium]|nr:hypothetical protein [bacterium]
MIGVKAGKGLWHVIILSIFTVIFFHADIKAAHNYSDALHLTTYFYGAQRCGNTQSWIHGACHVKDTGFSGTQGNIAGGWHDCGDHILFGQTAPFSAGALLEGYLAYPSVYEDRYSQAYSAPPPNGIPDILVEVKIMTDWLIAACDGTRFYYQKGHSADHNHMSEPRDQSITYNVNEGGEKDGPRNVYYRTSGGSNVAGDAAAALALMAIAYQPYNATYATQCFNKAKQYFAIGDTSPGTVGGADCCYGAANWQDDMAWGAAAIYRASVARGAPENTYLTKAQTYIASGHGAGSWPLCYDHTELLAHYNLWLLTGNTTHRNWIRDEVNYYKANLVTCGIGQYAFVTSWGSLRYAANMAFGAMLYHKISDDTTAYDFAKKNVDFILGTHGDIAGSPGAPQGRSFVVGYTNPDYPSAGSVRHPHHRAAFGYTAAENADQLWQQENNNPGSVPFKHVLYGALVGGPRSSCSNYNDKIDDYVANEVGIDYNACLVGAIAGVKYVLNPPAPTLTHTPNLSHTRTRTPTVTPTFTITPIPPPTQKLNLEIQSDANSCGESMRLKIRITNWETTAVPLTGITVRIWINNSVAVTAEQYDGRVRNSSNNDVGTTTMSHSTTALGSVCGSGDRTANKYVSLSWTGPDLPANGGYLYYDGVVRRTDWQPLDGGSGDTPCNDYTRTLSSWSAWTNTPYFTLYQGTDLVCEYTNASTRDANTGINPCTGADGCPVAGTFTMTPTRTRTSTFTRTRTPTFTRTATPLPPTATFTRTRTGTPTFTRTRTGTPTFTRTSTPVPPTLTFTGTRTGTPTFTRTRTETLTFTRTPTPVPPTLTFTQTRTGTPTFTRTSTPVPPT